MHANMPHLPPLSSRHSNDRASSPPLVNAATGTVPALSSTSACHNCGTVFTKSTAKFCSKCGMKKIVPRKPSVDANGTAFSGTGSRSSDAGAKTAKSSLKKEGGNGALANSEATDNSGNLHSSTAPTLTFHERSEHAATAVSATTPVTSSGRTGGSAAAAGGSSSEETIKRASSTVTRKRDSITNRRKSSTESAPAAGAAAASSSSSTTDAAADTVNSGTAPAACGGGGNGTTSSSSLHHGTTTRTTTDSEEDMMTLSPSPEEEAQYTAWSTLGPEGLTPEMLQTDNATHLRQWRKGTLIGRGTYGSVYLGLLPDGSFYAVKCVEIGNRATDNFNVRELVSLSREINMMHRLQHKNLCNFKGVVYDADSTSVCMFMEYIGGGSLSSLVKRFKPLPPQVVRSWTKQLLTGLLYLHTQRIIHRDVKGDNVLVDTTADPASESQIKLVDFGAARRLTDAVSQSRTVIGTPYWMAPEVVDVTGEGKGYSYKADVWSVGCTVAEMLTGKPPWPNRANAPSAIMMIASAEGMPTEIPEEEATPGCLDFMKKCFERDPEKRPTVEELMRHPWIKGKME